MEAETLERPLATEQSATAIALPPETRAVIALNSSKTELDLRALATKHVAIVEIKDKAGREQAHGAAMELMRARTDIEKISKAARDDATKFSKAVIAEEKRLVGIVEGEEKRLKDLRDQWDDAEKARREDEAAAERARVLAITERISAIKSKPVLAAQCRTAAAVQRLIDTLETADMTGLEEFEQEAMTARSTAIASMAAMRDAKQAEEDERARIKAEQEAEAARLAAQRAEIEHQQAEARAAEAKARAEHEAKEAELQRQRAAFEAEQAAARKAREAEMEQATCPDNSITGKAVADRRDEPITERTSSAIETVVSMLEDDSVTVIPATLLLEAATELDAPVNTAGDVAYLPVTMVEPQTPLEPSDADVIWIAAKAVADAYGWSTTNAITRLAGIDWQPA